MAAPMPRLAPVTIATLSFKRAIRLHSLSPVLRGEGGGEGRGARGVEKRSIRRSVIDRQIERSSTWNVARPSPQPSPRSTGKREKFDLRRRRRPRRQRGDVEAAAG